VNPADLMRFAWPIAAIASITHRISGVVLFIGIAFGLYALDLSLSSETGFDSVKGLMLSPLGRLVTWALLAALAYHFVAGLKHLLLDLEVADSLAGSQFAARVTLLFAAVLIVLAGIWVFQA
jgi:succinate dehydrogenase / fumarate reductase cytochrome b subunit